MDPHTGGLSMDHHVHPDMRIMYHHAKMAAAAQQYDPSKISSAVHGYDPTKMSATGGHHHHHTAHYDPSSMMCMSVRGRGGDSLLNHLPNMTGYPYNSYDLQAMAAHASSQQDMRDDKWATGVQ